jgi:hypothetical protein
MLDKTELFGRLRVRSSARATLQAAVKYKADTIATRRYRSIADCNRESVDKP